MSFEYRVEDLKQILIYYSKKGYSYQEIVDVFGKDGKNFKKGFITSFFDKLEMLYSNPKELEKSNSKLSRIIVQNKEMFPLEIVKIMLEKRRNNRRNNNRYSKKQRKDAVFNEINEANSDIIVNSKIEAIYDLIDGFNGDYKKLVNIFENLIFDKNDINWVFTTILNKPFLDNKSKRLLEEFFKKKGDNL